MVPAAFVGVNTAWQRPGAATHLSYANMMATVAMMIELGGRVSQRSEGAA